MLPLFLVALAFPTAASAQSEEAASQVFWQFARCAATKSPGEANRLLSLPADADAYRAARRYAQEHADCGGFERLAFKLSLFRGTLAGALFVRKYGGRVLPSFASLPPVYNERELRDAIGKGRQSDYMLASFAKCVFRHRSDDVRLLLQSPPFGQVERVKWAEIAPTLNGCMPAEPGTQLHFSRVSLRALLGEAAYQDDMELARMSSSSAENGRLAKVND